MLKRKRMFYRYKRKVLEAAQSVGILMVLIGLLLLGAVMLFLVIDKFLGLL
ncbi:hypothetical protein ACUNIZ_07405 [Serratia sp. IR-2025]